MSKDKAIEEAVDFAIKENFLDGFFKTQRAEITGMILTEFDEEQAHRIWRKDGYIEGIAEGAQQKAIENAINALKMELSPEQVSQITNLPLCEVIKLKEELFVKA